MRAALLAGMIVLLPATAALAAEALPVPQGPVVLTIAGVIGTSNRPPFEASEDTFLNFHERSFDKAAEFDLAMLEALGMHEIEVRYADWPKPHKFQGPWLKDVLAAVKAGGATLTVLALDGYAQEVPRASLDKHAWLVALKRDGRYLKIGQRGPTWVLFAPAGSEAATEEDEQQWPWAAFFIEVK
jgi:hypothetical protein